MNAVSSSPATPAQGGAYRLDLPRFLALLLGGALFGFGLAASTMIQPQVVLSFLRWQDFGLVLVMGGGVVLTALAYALLPRWRQAPLLGGNFERHASAWNRDTVIGSALFGIGWGLCGVCPGPAIAGLGAGNWDLLWALAGIFAGAWWQGREASRG